MSKLPYHISGKLHVSGTSKFIGDEAPQPGMLFAKFLFSPVAYAQITNLDISQALAYPGVFTVLTAKDVPHNQIGHVIKDEPLFPEKFIMYHAQPLAMVLSEDPLIAEEAVKLIKLEYNELEPILDVDNADKLKEWYVPERKIERGDVLTALKTCPHVLECTFESPAQEHFYLETQRCRAIPGEDDRICLFSATQSTMEVQEVVSHLLNVPAHKIIVDVPRLGGAFGGKERAGTIWACFAALGTYHTKRPVEVLLTREEDMAATGKRHPFKSYYSIGYDDNGKIHAYDITLLANGGAYADLSIAILERAMFHAENAYFIPHVRIRGRACRTNLPPNTAFRGFGAPQGIMVIEHLMDTIADKLSIDKIAIRQLNAYKNGDIAPYGQPICESSTVELLERLKVVSDYDNLLKETDAFNKAHTHLKQSIGIIPVKFGISFTTALLNQGSALIWIYIDGTVSVTTGGVEMGQEVSTKIAIVVSRILGVPIENIRVESNNTQRVGNASPTAASTGADINGNAARIAAEELRERLVPVALELLHEKYSQDFSAENLIFIHNRVFAQASDEKTFIEFKDLIRHAYNSRVGLGAYGYYSTPGVWFDREQGHGHPFHYYVYGCALVRIEQDLNLLTTSLKDVFIVHETAPSLHPDIDRGQIIGAFMQAYGWLLLEEVQHDQKGRYLAISPSTYKIPGIKDIPENFVVEMVQTKRTQTSVFGSKAIGEPPFIYGIAAWLAMPK